MNCVSSGTSLPRVPMRWVIHHSLNRKRHMNRRSLLRAANEERSREFHFQEGDEKN
jgi:hypothetical protein